jgi:hypothetical protein
MPRVDVPEEGHYRRRLTKGGVWCAVKIWHGFPLDPVTGELLVERSPIWRAMLNGEHVDVWTQWPDCSGEPITEDEYMFLLKDHLWSVDNAPDSPQANPRAKIDLHKIRPIF